MASPYKSLINGTAGLIKTFGYPGTLVRDDGTEFPITLVMTEYNPMYVDGNMIEVTDRQALIAAKSMTISPDGESYRLVENGNTHRIVTVKRLAPGGQDILFELQLRPAAL